MRALLFSLTLLAAGPAAAGPVVVELFTSQACEACPRANAAVAGLANRPDVLPLTFPVDYWDYLGWADTLAAPAFAERQRGYGRALRLRGLQTPLVVIDGAEHASGLKPGAIARMIRTRHARAGSQRLLRLDRDGGVRVSGGEAPAGGAEVWLVRYDPSLVTVAVADGPNRGRIVPHRNVVREMVKLGSWTGAPRTYSLPATPTDGLRGAVLIQAVRSREILDSAVQP